MDPPNATTTSPPPQLTGLSKFYSIAKERQRARVDEIEDAKNIMLSMMMEYKPSERRWAVKREYEDIHITKWVLLLLLLLIVICSHLIINYYIDTANLLQSFMQRFHHHGKAFISQTMKNTLNYHHHLCLTRPRHSILSRTNTLLFHQQLLLSTTIQCLLPQSSTKTRIRQSTSHLLTNTSNALNTLSPAKHQNGQKRLAKNSLHPSMPHLKV